MCWCDLAHRNGFCCCEPVHQIVVVFHKRLCGLALRAVVGLCGDVEDVVLRVYAHIDKLMILHS